MDLVIPPPNSALMLGTTVHEAVAHNLSQKVETGEDMREADMLDHFASIFDLERTKTMWYSDEDPGEFKDLGIGIVSVHRQLVSPGIMPLAVEKGFIMSLSKRPKEGDDPEKPAEKYPPIEGWIDAVNKNGGVIETKTTRSKPKAIKPAHMLQGTVYTAGMLTSGLEVGKGQVDYLVKTKKPYPVSFPMNVTRADWIFFETILDQVTKGVKNEVFLPNRSFFGCSRRWCGFWNICEQECGGRVPD